MTLVLFKSAQNFIFGIYTLYRYYISAKMKKKFTKAENFPEENLEDFSEKQDYLTPIYSFYSNKVINYPTIDLFFTKNDFGNLNSL